MGDAHTHGVVAVSLAFPRALEWRALNRWLTDFRIRHGEKLLRLKGVVELADRAAPVAIQGVHHVFHPPLALPHLQEAGLKGARLVVIARDLTADEIRASWQRFTDEQARTATC